VSASRDPTPYVDLDRAAWSRLAASTPQPLTAEEVEGVRGLGDQVDLAEVRDVYLPLSRLLNLHVRATDGLHGAWAEFLGGRLPARTPYVVAVAGSVAVGKSTTARLLQLLLARWPEHPQVSLVTTDGFLLPNAELARRGLLGRKGFPESYDRRALLRFVTAVKSGAEEVRAPLYSHLVYDVVPDEEVVVHRPDVLVLEGLNVLQPARPRAAGGTGLAISDFFDFSVYVDARPDDVRSWYVRRFLRLRDTAFRDPSSYFRRYADLSPDEAAALAEGLWDTINGPNLVENIEPTRQRATLVLRKGADHAVEQVRLRKL
jgi:type I pantothenate kinase